MRISQPSRQLVPPRSAFAGFRFPPEVIVVAVDHVTIYRWVQRFTPLLADAARPCRHSVGDRWQVDESYLRVAGRWQYVYRAVDQFGQVIDVLASARRDAATARRFFEQAIGATMVRPTEATTDQASAYPA
jgi:transposase-like protein